MNCIDYHPSDELLAALAELPSGLRPEQAVVKSEVDGRRRFLHLLPIAEFEADDPEP